jgi:homoserine dehydrogenase
MVALDSPIAHVDGVFNAIVAQGDFIGSTVYEGRGAGAGPTASAVAADIVDIARGARIPAFAVPASSLRRMPSAAMDHHVGAYYIRLMVVDRPGVFADIATALRDAQVSMEAILQRTRAPGGPVPVVMTTHDVEEKAMRDALDRIRSFDAVLEPPTLIRIEPLAK